jgi:hypothetical protein
LKPANLNGDKIDVKLLLTSFLSLTCQLAHAEVAFIGTTGPGVTQIQGEIQTSNHDAIITITGFDPHLLLKGVTLSPDYDPTEIVGRAVRCNVITAPLPSAEPEPENLLIAMCILSDIAQPMSLTEYWISNGYGDWNA